MSDLQPNEGSVLRERFFEERMIEYLGVKAVVAAIFDLGAMLNGKSSNKTEDVLKAFRDVLLPEFAESVKEKALSTEEILKREAQSGPMKVQALNYDSKKRKRR